MQEVKPSEIFMATSIKDGFEKGLEIGRFVRWCKQTYFLLADSANKETAARAIQRFSSASGSLKVISQSGVGIRLEALRTSIRQQNALIVVEASRTINPLGIKGKVEYSSQPATPLMIAQIEALRFLNTAYAPTATRTSGAFGLKIMTVEFVGETVLDAKFKLDSREVRVLMGFDEQTGYATICDITIYKHRRPESMWNVTISGDDRDYKMISL